MGGIFKISHSESSNTFGCNLQKVSEKPVVFGISFGHHKSSLLGHHKSSLLGHHKALCLDTTPSLRAVALLSIKLAPFILCEVICRHADAVDSPLAKGIQSLKHWKVQCDYHVQIARQLAQFRQWAALRQERTSLRYLQVRYTPQLVFRVCQLLAGHNRVPRTRTRANKAKNDIPGFSPRQPCRRRDDSGNVLHEISAVPS